MSELNPAAAVASLISLAAIIVISRTSKVNVGVLAVAFAWVIGVYVAGLSARSILNGFPISLMAVLVGVTLLFAQAQANGTLDQIAAFAVSLARGHCALLPLLMFALTFALAAIGPGNIGAVALVAPMAMRIGGTAGISAFLMTLMVANGANAGAFSPVAPTGIIANGLITRLGLSMNPWSQVFLPSLIVQTVVALGGYLLFGGIKLWRQENDGRCEHHEPGIVKRERLTREQVYTVIAIGAFVLGVAVFQADAGFLAFALASALALARAADQEQALRLVPWDVIIMVCGVSTLVSLMEKTGGLDLFTSLIAGVSTPQTATGVLGLVAGLISVYSSSSGVVMPALIPLVPQLIQALGGGDAVALVSTINVGSHVVDVSPLSTLGAICIANAAPHEDKRKLFRWLLANGLVMAVVGAMLCLVIFGLLFG